MKNLFKIRKARKENPVHIVEWYDYREPANIYKDTMTDRGIGNAVINDCFFVLLSVDGVKVEKRY